MRRILPIVLLPLAVTPAAAYDQPVHEWLSRRAYGGPAQLDDNPADAQAAVDALRRRIYHAGANATNPELRARFLRRYPDEARFDAAAWKRFVMLNPDKRVVGFDDTPLPSGRAGVDVFALASRLPDDDQRNRERYRRRPDGTVESDRWGRPLPDDPATLEMGSLSGLSSQAHAHYQLPALQFSDDPAVLKRDPRRFAIPPTVHTFGAEMAETYTLLSILAARLPSGARLSVVLAGAAAHHIEDTANQIHTVQVGLYDFFVDATLEAYKRELLSIGGLVGAHPSRNEIGIQIIANHHTLLESLFKKHLLAPGDPVRTAAERPPTDPAFNADVDKLPPGCAPSFARALVMTLAEHSSREGPAVYAEIRKAADRRWSRAGAVFDPDHDDPDAALHSAADLGRFYDLEVRGVGRSDEALRVWWQRAALCATASTDTDTILAEHLIATRLATLDAIDARAAAYVPKPPATARITWWVPLVELGLVASLVLLAARVRRRRRAR
jgi:hypothetical protein